MNDHTPPPPLPHFSLALDVLARLSLGEADLLARELNVYSEAIRARAGRTSFTGAEIMTLFARMHDVAKIVPKVISAIPVDLDELATQIIPAPTPNGKRRIE